VVLLAVASLGVVGCSNTKSAGSATTSGATAPASTAAEEVAATTGSTATASTNPATTAASNADISADRAQRLLTASTFDDPTTLQQLDLYKESPAMVDAAAAAATASPSAAAKWAAVYVLANADGHGPDLAPFLTDTDATIRVMAAIGSIGEGESAGFPVLIDALSVDEPMASFEPAVPVWKEASMALAQHTGLTLGPAFDADPVDRSDAHQRWLDWWTANGTAVQFDAATESWSVG
jgi:hypothetical protein